MTWLFPLYLLGAGAIIGPILMHLRRRPPRQVMEFSSLMFLDAQTPVPVNKRRLEHWLLLLLRCLVLVLVALMFARPLWHRERNAAAAQGEAFVVLVDRSASMQRADLWKQALAQAEKVLADAKPDDRVMVAAFDGAVHPVWGFDEDVAANASRSAVVRQRLAEQRPGWGGTDLGKALQEAVSAYGGATSMTARRKHVVVISDLQEGARLETLRGLVWPENIRVRVIRVQAPNVDNLSLALAAMAPEAKTADLKTTRETTARVRVSNMRDSKVADFELAWENTAGEKLAGHIPPGASRVLPAPPAADNGMARTLRLSGDAWDFDNRIYMAPLQPKPARVVFVGDESKRNEPSSPLYYLSRALQTTASVAPELVVIPAAAIAVPEGTHVVIVSGAVLAEALAQSLRQFTEKGGLCIEVLDTAQAEVVARLLSGSSDLRISEGKVPPGGYLMLGEVDGAHPLLRPFTDDRLRDFTKLRFWKHRHVELGQKSAKEWQVIAKFDNAEPAILTRTLGKGRLVLLAAGWHPADSQLALSTKFVPLLYGWLQAAGFANEATASLLVGDWLPARVGDTVVTPDKRTVMVSAGNPVIAEMVGLYGITTAGEKPHIYAVNLPPEEGRVMPMDEDRLRQLGVKLEDAAAVAAPALADAEREHQATTEEEKQQRGWRWILGGVLAALAAETWLATRLKPGAEPQPEAA